MADVRVPDADQGLVAAEVAAEVREAVHAAWARLPDRTVAALELRFRERMRQKDIARLFGVTDPRMSRILSRGVAVLRAELEERDLHGLLGPDPEVARRTLGSALGSCLATSGAALHYQAVETAAHG